MRNTNFTAKMRWISRHQFPMAAAIEAILCNMEVSTHVTSITTTLAESWSEEELTVVSIFGAEIEVAMVRETGVVTVSMSMATTRNWKTVPVTYERVTSFEPGDVFVTGDEDNSEWVDTDLLEWTLVPLLAGAIELMVVTYAARMENVRTHVATCAEYVERRARARTEVTERQSRADNDPGSVW